MMTTTAKGPVTLEEAISELTEFIEDLGRQKRVLEAWRAELQKALEEQTAAEPPGRLPAIRGAA